MANVSQSEPALTTSTIVAIVSAAVGLLVAFGLGLTDDQKLAIIGFVTVVAPLVAGFITRKQVTPSNEVAVQVSPGGDFVAGDALVDVENGTVVDVAPLTA